MQRTTCSSLLASLLLCALVWILALLPMPAHAAGEVGTGTPESCTEAALDSALTGGGAVTFNCGPTPTVITLSAQKSIGTDTAIDGGGSVSLGAHGSRHFVVNAGATLVLTSITLRDGYANGDGGSIFNSGTLVLSNTLFTANRAVNGSGGAIVSYGTLVVAQSTFAENIGANGGAIYPRWTGAHTTVAGSVFRRNSTTSQTDGWGGAILLWDGAALEIRDSLFTENSATKGGGIFNFPASTIVITGTELSANTARYGAAIYNELAALALTDSILRDNQAERDGGALENRGGAVTIHNSVFSANRVDYLEGGGGAINNIHSGDTAGAVTLTDVTATANQAGQRGGGIANDGTAQLTRVTLDHNNAPAGGGIYNQGALELTTSTLSDNTAATAGALYQAAGSLTVRYSTIADNGAADGTAIYLDQGQHDGASFQGVIVAGGACGGDGVQSGGHNLEQGNTCGFDQATDRPDSDPLLQPLAANGGLLETRLPAPGSPAIDTGGAGCPSPDQRGESRPLGSACDIGAVEAASLPPTCGAELAPSADTTVSSATPDSAQGDWTTLWVARSGATAAHALIAFDPTALQNAVPEGATLSSAVLQLTAAPPGATRTGMQVAAPITDVLDVRAVGQPWTESATWNTQPAAGPSYARGGTLGQELLQIDVTTLAMQWLSGAVPETSLLLLPGGAEVDVTLESREGQHPPRLIVQCAPPPPLEPTDPQAQNERQEQAIAQVQAESATTVTVLFARGALQHATFDIPGPSGMFTDALSLWFLDTHQDLLGTTDSWQLIRRSPDGQHEFFRQVHAGIPVYPAEIAVDLDGNRVVGAGGNYVAGIALAPTPSLSAEQAEQIAVNIIEPAAELLGDTQLRYVNLGLLGNVDKQTRLAWQLALRAGEGDYTVFVDAHAGAILFTDLRRKDGYDLDLENGNNEQLKDLCGIFDNDNIDANFDGDARTATDNIWTTYYFWRNNFGRDSYDDDGEQIEWNIHVNFGGNNAAYNPGCDIFGSSNGRVARDTVAHEFTHAVVHSELGLPYSNQQGALDESLADTFGAFVDGDWVHGNRYSPAVRDLSNPPAFGQPDRMSNFVTTMSDFGGVHTNSGILNKAVFLITDGQNFNTHNVRGMGRVKAQRLYYNVLVNRLRGNSDLYDMARQMLAEAKALRGAGFLSNADVCTVIEAYAAVELGPADRDCNGVEDSVQDDDNDGVPNAYNDPAGTPWDNCRTIRNTNQADNDGDNVGDACDADSDNDGVSDFFAGNPNDNCRWVPNPSQNDRDKDGEGDACDDDADGDWVANALDNCPRNYNPDQSDIDRDRVGDVCDLDAENDLICNIAGPRASGLGLVAGVGCFPGRGSTGFGTIGDGGFGMLPKAADNCPLHANNNQADADADSVGDVCDLCPGVRSSDNGDPDHDGRGNGCDEDDDNDGVLDFQPDGVTPLDNCRETPNATQSDPDGNGIGFACDAAEQAAWLAVQTKLARMQFKPRGTIRVPIDNCPQCGPGYLAKDLTTQVILQAPVAISARVVDSGGFVVAKSLAFAPLQTLRFQPPPFAGIGLRSPGMTVATGTQAPGAATAFGPAADDTRYYLEIAAADGVDFAQTYDVTIATTTTVADQLVNKSFLPIVTR